MPSAADVVAKARDCIGTPYQHQQRTKLLAMDCVGLPVCVAAELNIPIEDCTVYPREPNPARMQSYLDRNLTRVRKDGMQAGDVAWIKFATQPQHLAIVGDYSLGGFSLIHADNTVGNGSVVEHRLDPIWLARIVAVWRFPGID